MDTLFLMDGQKKSKYCMDRKKQVNSWKDKKKIKQMDDRKY